MGITAAILGAVMVLLTLAIVRLVSIVETEREAEGKVREKTLHSFVPFDDCVPCAGTSKPKNALTAFR